MLEVDDVDDAVRFADEVAAGLVQMARHCRERAEHSQVTEMRPDVCPFTAGQDRFGEREPLLATICQPSRGGG